MALYVTRPRRDEVRIGRGLPSDFILCRMKKIPYSLRFIKVEFCYTLVHVRNINHSDYIQIVEMSIYSSTNNNKY